jgi:hypothetical protein
MKTPRTLQQFFENQPESQKEKFKQLKLAVIDCKVKDLKPCKRLNPF